MRRSECIIFPTYLRKFSKILKIMVECVQGSRKGTPIAGKSPPVAPPVVGDRLSIGNTDRMGIIGMDIAFS